MGSAYDCVVLGDSAIDMDADPAAIYWNKKSNGDMVTSRPGCAESHTKRCWEYGHSNYFQTKGASDGSQEGYQDSCLIKRSTYERGQNSYYWVSPSYRPMENMARLVLGGDFS